jgi:hypothetical protein
MIGPFVLRDAWIAIDLAIHDALDPAGGLENNALTLL